MDERFNDGTELPYGWFTEGWTVKDGVIQTEASSGSSFDLEKLMGNNKKEDQDPEEAEKEGEGEGEGEAEGEGEGEGNGNGNKFDISSLFESFMGGNSKPNYLLTPPLVVNEGETLVFSAKKGKDGGSSSGMSISLGAADKHQYGVTPQEYRQSL